jgi:hypothetical protein
MTTSKRDLIAGCKAYQAARRDELFEAAEREPDLAVFHRTHARLYGVLLSINPDERDPRFHDYVLALASVYAFEGLEDEAIIAFRYADSIDRHVDEVVTSVVSAVLDYAVAR